MILVVGDVITDIVVRAETGLRRGTDTEAEITLHPGGSGANIACWIGHLGGAVRFAGRVGAADADWHEAALCTHSVQPRLARDPARETGRAVAIVEGASPEAGAAGERSFYTDRGANLGLRPDDLPLTLLTGVRLLHVSGHTLLSPPPAREAARGLMRAAQARGIAVSVDAGSAAPLRAAGAAAFLAWAQPAGTLFCNEAEAACLQPMPGAGIVQLVVTRGVRGAALFRPGHDVLEVAAAPARVVDATGAGDAFAGAALLGALRGQTPPEWLAAAAAAGARAVARIGARPPRGA